MKPVLPGSASKLTLLTLTLSLMACQPDDTLPQLHAWIAQARHDNAHQTSRDGDALAPLTLVAFQPAAYLAADLPSPFGDDMESDSLTPIGGDNARPPQRDAPHPMENFALASMHMVGTLTRGLERLALVQVAGVLHRIQLGDYLGQRFGMVQHISESSITLEELVRDPDGNWTAHNTALTMENFRQGRQ